jgi:hypothetical protein
LGLGTRGAYITAGLKGIYYRKRLGSAGVNSSGESELSVAAVIVTWLVILAVGAIVGSRSVVCGVADAALTGILIKASAEDGAIISYRTREGFPRLAVAW